MNKTVTINISGIIFHIEEDAYEKLSKYIRTIRSYFSETEGRDEIMADIESRIAELLQEKTNQVKQVVLMTDVNEVINLMGKPEEFANESDTNNGSTNQQANFNTESTFVPPVTGRRRVFRDPDDRILGGVCSGIGAYFNIDPLWLRIILAISFFAFGFGFLFYLLLWIIIPQAKTTAEKLEMRGESVNINNISRSISEEMDHLKKKMDDLKNEASSIGSKENRQRARTSVNKFADFLVSLFGSLFVALAKFFTVIFIAIGLALLIGLLASTFGASNAIHINKNGHEFSYSLSEFVNNIFNSPFQGKLALIGLFLFVGVPLIMLIYSGIKYLLNIKNENRSLKIGSRVLWLAGLVLLIYSGITLANSFSEQGTSRQKVAIMQPKSDTLYLKTRIDAEYNEEGAESRVMIGKVGMLKINGEPVNFGTAEMDIIPSQTDSFELILIKTSRSDSKKEALNNAKTINYTFSQQDSLIEFNSYFDLPSNQKWRNQNVKLLLKVPKNKVIYLGHSMKHIIYDIDNVTDTYDGDMVGRRWKMTDEGLACVDCENLPDYRTHPTFPTPPPAPPHPSDEE